MIQGWEAVYPHLQSFVLSKDKGQEQQAETETRTALSEYQTLQFIQCYCKHLPEHRANALEEPRLFLAWFVLAVQNSI